MCCRARGSWILICAQALCRRLKLAKMQALCRIACRRTGARGASNPTGFGPGWLLFARSYLVGFKTNNLSVRLTADGAANVASGLAVAATVWHC